MIVGCKEILSSGQIKFCIVTEAYTEIERKREKLRVVDFAEKIFAISIRRNHYSLGWNYFISGNTFPFSLHTHVSCVLHSFSISIYFLFLWGSARKSTL